MSIIGKRVTLSHTIDKNTRIPSDKPIAGVVVACALSTTAHNFVLLVHVDSGELVGELVSALASDATIPQPGAAPQPYARPDPTVMPGPGEQRS